MNHQQQEQQDKSIHQKQVGHYQINLLVSDNPKSFTFSFCNSFDISNFTILQLQKVYALINQPKWIFKNQDKQIWQCICKLLKFTTIKQLKIFLNYSKIIKQIENIHFIQLKVLTIQSCNLSSIQSLTYISMPKLKLLSLFNNKLIHIKSLLKCFIESPIQLVSIDWNPIITLNNRQQMRRININKGSKIDSLNLNWINKCYKNIVFQDLIYYIPFQYKNLYSIYYSQKNNEFMPKGMILQNIFPKAFIERTNQVWFHWHMTKCFREYNLININD